MLYVNTMKISCYITSNLRVISRILCYVMSQIVVKIIPNEVLFEAYSLSITV